MDLPRSMAQTADQKWQHYCAGAAEAGLQPPDDPETVDAFKRVFAFSDFVSGQCIRFPEMILEMLSSGDIRRKYPPGRYREKIDNCLPGFLKDDTREWGVPGTGFPMPVFQKKLRTVRRREMVRIVFRDLSGLATLEETMAELSAFADACLDRTLKHLYRWHCARYGTPVGSNGNPQQLVILAMGKLGARELNVSSDIDLIFAYPEAGATRDTETPSSNEEFFTRLCRHLIQLFSTTTADGRVFRVDMGLRPFGESGPVVMNFEAMENYYQTQGREWERYAWIKARVAAGDKSEGYRLIGSLKPFIYRRYLDYGVFDALREMKQKISSEVLKKKMAGNIKLGAGGIREIEFFGQMFQLIRGGVIPELQQRRILKVMQILADKGIITKEAMDALISAYRFLRNTENRLQAFSDRQTHDLPIDPDQRNRLAVSMNFPGWEAFEAELGRHMSTVHDHFKRLLKAPGKEDENDHLKTGLSGVWLGTTEKETALERLKDAGYDEAGAALSLLKSLKDAPATRALSTEGRKRLDQLMPRVIKAAGSAKTPGPVLNRITDLIKTIQQRTSYLALLLENTGVLSHLVRFSDASSWLISFMARHPVLLDELLDSHTLYQTPEKKDLETAARRRLSRIEMNDLELFIEELCIFKQVNTLRVAAADVSGMLPLMKVSDRLSWIAETILDQVLAYVRNDLVRKHGTPICRSGECLPESGFAIIAYGKLGGLELGYDSDLDLVFLHEQGQGPTRGGPRPIDTDQFFARMGQRIVHILTAHTRAGKLYETDMRLRPSGSSGPLVSKIDAFRRYQLSEAWTWEHQAIVRARAICGDPELVKGFETLRRDVLVRPREEKTLLKEVSEMRARLRQEHGANLKEGFHLKQDPGGMVDIEFLSQYLVLQKSQVHDALARWSDNVRILESLTHAGVLDPDTALTLKQAYLAYRLAAHRLSLQEKPAMVPRERFPELQKTVVNIWKQIIG